MKKRLVSVLSLILCLAVMLPAASVAETVKPNVTDLMKTYTKLDLNPYRGKTVLLNFFTEWCYYCMKEMPDIKTVSEMYDESAFQVVLIHPWDGEDATNTENVKEKFGMQDMVFFEDEDRMVASMVGIPGYPCSLFLNPDGTLEAAAASMLTLEQLTAQLDAMGVPRKAEEE